MKRLSLQWRFTLMTAVLIAVACVLLNLAVLYSGTSHMDALNKYVAENGAEDTIYIDLSEMQWEEFAGDFALQVQGSKAGFRLEAWIITVLITLISGTITYFVSGRCLRPLRELSKQAEQIQMQNLMDSPLPEQTIQEYQQLVSAFNGMLERLGGAFEVQRRFTGNAAHELKTPLALMQMQLELWMESTELSGTDQKNIKSLQGQLERLTALVRTLLDMSEMERIPRTERVELAPMAEEILQDLEPAAQKRGITMKASGNVPTVIGSDVLLYRMLYNLVENAIKYGKQGGMVAVTLEESWGKIEIRVIDDGPGIPEEMQEQIFEPFFRVDKSRSRAFGGVGLGLALAQQIASLHGGNLTVEKSDKTGTVFLCKLS